MVTALKIQNRWKSFEFLFTKLNNKILLDVICLNCYIENSLSVLLFFLLYFIFINIIFSSFIFHLVKTLEGQNVSKNLHNLLIYRQHIFFLNYLKALQVGSVENDGV